MKKFILSALCLATSLVASATDLFTGSQFVTWGQGLQLTADKFADAKAGDKLVITYTGATDGIELKVMDDFHRLPGSRQWCPIDGNGALETFLTPAAVAELQASGLEMIGNNFTVTKVELLDGKDNVTENTVWTGYFWMDSWSTLELAKTCFNGINWSEYKAIRFYSEANRTDYFIKVMTNWEESGYIAEAGSMTMTNEYAELSLEGIDMAAKLALSETFFIQCNKEGGDPFNFTAVELVKNEETGISTVSAGAHESKTFDINGRVAANGAKGIVIKDGRKMIVK